MAKQLRTPKAVKLPHDADIFPALPGQPQVANLRKLPSGWDADPGMTYIGRSGHGLISLWGNPIRAEQPCRECGKSHTTRETIPCYARFLQTTLAAQPHQLRQNILSLTGKTLVCFCAPAPCHGHEIIRLWRQLAVEFPEEANAARRAAGVPEEP